MQVNTRVRIYQIFYRFSFFPVGWAGSLGNKTLECIKKMERGFLACSFAGFPLRFCERITSPDVVQQALERVRRVLPGFNLQPQGKMIPARGLYGTGRVPHGPAQ
jgi:hypothetical protein